VKLVTAEQMRTIEQSCVDRGITLDRLMQNAGTALAAKAEQMAGHGTILLLVGPGNNGGDGLVAAALLAARGRHVSVYTFKRPDASPFDGYVVRAEDDPDRSVLRLLAGTSALLVDALLGIGQSRTVEGELATIVSCANTTRGSSTRALAVDIPTGVEADGGKVLGQAFLADGTLCMGFVKLGCVLYPGSAYAGSLYLTDAGIPEELGDTVPQSLTDSQTAATLMPERGYEANKGSSGRVLAITGSHDFSGAPVLVSLAAYRAGAGLVELAIPDRIKSSVASHALEPIFLPLPDVDGKLGPNGLGKITESFDKARAFVLGSGMGLSESTIQLVRNLLELLRRPHGPPGVIDADGLNAVANIPGWHEGLSNVVVTPHPGEMSRLTGLQIQAIQEDRIGVARRFALQWGVTVVLKGARTVVASPTGEIAINFSGGPNLATAGTGDVLTGIIGGLLAQGSAPWDAARCGVFLHGCAGDLWRAQQGDVGMLASDLLPILAPARQSILGEKEAS
jgi:ADP-dependent NAD(P)H-hydrate dehydratase / NAD(P)H-hydrate epimerase